MADVVSLKDIEEIYGKDLIGYNRFGQEAIGTKINKEFLDEDIEVEILTRMGPYATIRLNGSTKQGLIIPVDKIKDKELPKALDLFTPILDKYFPNGWYYNDYTQLLYLHYPELQITNSMGLKHTIYDLVVRLYLQVDNGYISSMEGCRFSYSKEEIEACYSHSHLPTLGDSEEEDGEIVSTFNSFCLGGSSPFNILLASMGKRNSVKEFELFLMQLYQYLTWESLEGNPHISIRDIGSAQPSNGHANPISTTTMNKISLYVLDLLSTNYPASNRVVVQYVSGYVFDPSLDAEWVYENIEKSILTKFPDINDYLATWDDRKQLYVTNTHTQSEVSLPNTSEEEVIKRLNITPRIIEQEQVEQFKPTMRLSKNNTTALIQSVNRLLNNGVLNAD